MSLVRRSIAIVSAMSVLWCCLPSSPRALAQTGGDTSMAAPAAPPISMPGYAAPQGYVPAESVRSQTLQLERQQLLSRRVSLAAPITLMSVGLSLVIVGWGVVYPTASGDYCTNEYGYSERCSDWNGAMLTGALLGITGSVLAVVGTAILPGRIVRRIRRQRELDRIDGELRMLGARASLTPWIGSGSGAPIGLSSTLRF
jgi:hypothetical protein